MLTSAEFNPLAIRL